MDAETKALPPGSLATLRAPSGEALGLVTFNPHSLIAARVLSSNPEATVDALFLGRRLAQATALRDRLIGVPFYRLIHAEADGLPGVIVDRFGDALVVQVNTAGMELLTPVLLEALEAELSPTTIVLKNDSPVRELEGLKREVTVAKGEASGTVELIENGARFVADLSGGQKTGWFYDQRDNRRFMAGLAKDARVLDVYSYSGGFGVLAATQGAKSVICIDRSAARARCGEGGGRLERRRQDRVVREERGLRRAGEARRQALRRRDLRSARLREEPQGPQDGRRRATASWCGWRRPWWSGAASCSSPPARTWSIRRCSPNRCDAACATPSRSGRILLSSGAALDHPVHPGLPETAYLKALTLQLD